VNKNQLLGDGLALFSSDEARKHPLVLVGLALGVHVVGPGKEDPIHPSPSPTKARPYLVGESPDLAVLHAIETKIPGGTFTVDVQAHSDADGVDDDGKRLKLFVIDLGLFRSHLS